MLLWHGTFFINSLAHVHGSQRYLTGDDSRNKWWLAILTCGEGWHNNHHAYQSSTRQGFRWYQWDLTYYVLKAASWMGLVWDLRSAPAEVVNNERRLGRMVVEKVARQLAETFPADGMAAQVRPPGRTATCGPTFRRGHMRPARMRQPGCPPCTCPSCPPPRRCASGRPRRFRVPEVSLDEVTALSEGPSVSCCEPAASGPPRAALGVRLPRLFPSGPHRCICLLKIRSHSQGQGAP